MALRGHLGRLIRTRALCGSGQPSRAQSVAVLGAPFSRGQKRRGVEHGPKVIRDAGLIERLSGLDYAVHDFGDLAFHHPETDEPYMNVKFPRTVGAASKKLSGAVSRAVGSGHTLVVLGGDHSLAVGSVGGHVQQCPDLCLVWIDAHADINTPVTSPSGNLHGQPVAFMLKELRDKMPDIPGFSWVKPFLSCRDLVYIGLRDVDPGEYHIMKNLGIQYFTMRDIDRLGIQRVTEVALDHVLARKQRPIHLSFDIDAFDPSLAPATGTRVNGGLTYREGIYITEEIHNTGLLSVMDLVEVNPVLGPNREAVEATASLAVDVIASSLGQTREGAHAVMHEIPSVKEDDTEQLCL
ncbi:arginase-2, mitochondrial [Dunckerocampus dactyliophorus]|uniref:arginase-2, mitochondrial n=1 Tax=Dunckerocampus dactyliophorus TaxID=161453 RepID=UPI002406BEAA|nr:arginase-2, mitochondrial [Dunckerocampus dactyliophorus]